MIKKTFDEAGCYYVAVNYQEEMEGFPQFLYLVTFSQGSHCETNIINIPQMMMSMIKYIETPCEALPARLSQLQTSMIICLSKKSTRFVEARSK